MSTALVRIRTEEERLAVTERATAMLAQARTPSEAKKVADLAKAAETYAKLQKAGDEAIGHARAICVEALALMGEMLKQVGKATGTAGLGRPRIGGSRVKLPNHQVPTLADQGIPKKQSMVAQSLATVKEKKPELFEKVKAGKVSVAAAHVEVKRQEKRDALAEKAKATSPAKVNKATDWKIIRGEVGNGDACPLLDVECDSVRMVFADPPYNIGFEYGEGYDDRQADLAYLSWCERWMNQCADLLTPDGSMWVLINDEYAAEYALILKRLGLTIRNWIIWYETFGVNCTDKFNRTKRHLFYCLRDAAGGVFHFDAVSRPSDRQLKYGDARANPAGKVLDDVWTDIPRLVGTATERIPDFPTQLPLALLRRIVSCATDPGDLVLDPFNGSGTTGAVCIELGRRYLGVERSKEFARLSELRLKGVRRVDTARD